MHRTFHGIESPRGRFNDEPVSLALYVRHHRGGVTKGKLLSIIMHHREVGRCGRDAARRVSPSPRQKRVREIAGKPRAVTCRAHTPEHARNPTQHISATSCGHLDSGLTLMESTRHGGLFYGNASRFRRLLRPI